MSNVKCQKTSNIASEPLSLFSPCRSIQLEAPRNPSETQTNQIDHSKCQYSVELHRLKPEGLKQHLGRLLTFLLHEVCLVHAAQGLFFYNAHTFPYAPSIFCAVRNIGHLRRPFFLKVFFSAAGRPPFFISHCQHFHRTEKSPAFFFYKICEARRPKLPPAPKPKIKKASGSLQPDKYLEPKWLRCSYVSRLHDANMSCP